MPLTDFLPLIPEDKRATFEAEISKAVYIASDADAERFVESNELVRKANQRYRDPKIQEFKDKFLKEEVPKLLEEERKKGAKQPWELEIEKLKEERETERRAFALERQKNRALAMAQEKGIPLALVEKFIGLTDEETDAGMKALADIVIPYRENAVKEELGKYGGQKRPQGGATGGSSLESMYAEAVKKGDMATAIALKEQMGRAE